MNDKPNCYALNWSPRADKCNDCAVNADCYAALAARLENATPPSVSQSVATDPNLDMPKTGGR